MTGVDHYIISPMHSLIYTCSPNHHPISKAMSSSERTGSSSRVKRATEISDEEKAKIAAMQKPSDMPADDSRWHLTWIEGG